MSRALAYYCYFEEETCHDLQCFQNPKNPRYLDNFIASCSRAYMPSFSHLYPKRIPSTSQHLHTAPIHHHNRPTLSRHAPPFFSSYDVILWLEGQGQSNVMRACGFGLTTSCQNNSQNFSHHLNVIYLALPF